jgi:hypothetical protein
MTKTISKIALAIALLCALASAQVTLTSTTLSNQVLATDTYVILASTTGITGQGSLGQCQTDLYVDRELMCVISVSGSQVFVERDVFNMGTPVQQHASGAVVWIGLPSQFPSTNGQPSGYCNPAALNNNALPWIAVNTGQIYTCNALTNQWGTEGVLFLNPTCGSLATTTTTTDNGLVVAATNNVVHQFTTSATGGTTEFTCDIPIPSRLTAGKGVVLTDVDFLYGAQTTAISSIAAATVKTVTYPASTAAGAAAAGTVAAAGGTYTVTPTTLQKATTTSGQCYNEKLVFGTPIAVNTDNQVVTFDQVFTNSAAATVYQICGLLVHYYIPAPNN